MADPIGYRRWAISGGRIPPSGQEAAGILNASDDDAHLEIQIYFEGREPAGPYRLSVPARRAAQIRFADLEDPEPIPRDTDYASVIVSDVPVVVQHVRADGQLSTSTIAYAGD